MDHWGAGVFHDEPDCEVSSPSHFPASPKIKTVNGLLVKYKE